MDVFRQYIQKTDSVLELGAGAGVFSKELVTLAGDLVVSDISEQQLAINQSKMTERGPADCIREFLLLDVTDLSAIASNCYDVVISVGGALNYTFDKEATALSEILRVTKPGGIAIAGSVALLNSIIRFLSAIVEAKKQFGIKATQWLMDEGIQDAEHYPVENKIYLQMMNSVELDILFANQNVQLLDKRAAGIFVMAGEEAFDQAKANPELWELILSKEVELSRNPACLDCGTDLIYVVRKL